jgi:thioesterase domain-containing protein
LAGWSFGAWVAQAMCGLAQGSGLRQPLLYLIDPPAPDAGAELALIDEQHIQQVFQREFSARRPDDAPADDVPRYLQSLVACCKNNIASMAGHQPSRLEHTTTRLFIATRANPYGMGNAWQIADLQLAWQGLLPRMRSWQALDTDHYGIVAGQWARDIADIISTDSPSGEVHQHE